MNLEDKKKVVNDWFCFLHAQICKEFEILESKNSKEAKKFVNKNWSKKKLSEGGGLSSLLKNGNVFDKVGVNRSLVTGIFKKEFRSKILGAEKNGKYWASGVSVVAHMKNPKIPAFHFNTRFISTSKSWFGGGIDATPCIRDINEKKFFHENLKKICNLNNKNYSKLKKNCDKYFYLPHREETRGIGGIFFDYEMNNWLQNFKFVRDLGLGFIDISTNIIKKKINKSWTLKDKEKQYSKRGRYVEFNLLYDRGTKFGLHSGGNTDSILMSLPPIAKW
ncbi:MAG: coproporphyrinogen III oxidase [Pelagibacteraceae bacterium TMED216]|nr:MAG: coproporphyrinogen III oxidase [Pelagibacteraceae bacterium TMED216]|tara:strand:+ start:17048 stop:17878 length:831 start_codon:yes stop_codon:yes gene_type:complete